MVEKASITDRAQKDSKNMQNRKVKALAVPVLALGLILGTTPVQAADPTGKSKSKTSRSQARSALKLNPNAVPVSAEAISIAIAAAVSKDNGARYRAGGTGPDAFDCSGLVRWSYAQAGVKLPGGSTNQVNVVLPISKDQLQPGDLVFSGRGKGGISHVSLYIGDGKVVHATNARNTLANQIRIDDLDSSWVLTHKAYGRVVQ